MFGCQTYGWQMSGETYRGRLDHIAAVAADAGFAGLEAEVVMLGGFRQARRMQELLTATGLQLAALAFACQWRHAAETTDERAEAEGIIAFLSAFPGAKLVLVQLPGADRSDLAVRQANAVNCINDVAHRALDAGVQPTVHPNSPLGSIFRVADDYERLFGSLDAGVGFTPDVGHIAAGGMDPLATIKQYRDRIDHVHFKDIDHSGKWAATGDGRVNFRAIVSHLASTGYRGWIVFEDESEGSRSDPDAMTRRNGVYANEVLAAALRDAANGS